MSKSIISLIGRTEVRRMLETAAAKAAKENEAVGAPRATRVNGKTVIIAAKPAKKAAEEASGSAQVRKYARRAA